MIPMHLSDEQSVNSTMMMVGGLGRGAFRMARWLSRHKKSVEKPDNGLIKDALSVYRGGDVKSAGAGDKEALRSLIRDLSGARDISAGEHFVFSGERTDLSFFWKRNGQGCVLMPQSLLDTIPDNALKERAASVLAGAVLDGSLIKQPDGWQITRKGELEIYRMDFVKARLKSELNLSQDALIQLSGDKRKILHDRIDAALLKAGINPERYAGCNRATLNKDTLFIKDFQDQMQFYIPGTGRRGQMLLPKEDLFELDQKTLAVFLNPEKSYFISEQPGSLKRVSGEKLFARLDNKNRKDLSNLQKMGSLMEVDSDKLAISMDPSRAGESWIICDRHLNEYILTAKGEALLPGGVEVIVLDGGGRGDLLLPKSAIDVAAVPREQTEVFLQSRDPEKVAAFWKTQKGLDQQLPGSGELLIRAGSFKETAAAYEVKTAGSGFETVAIAKEDGRVLSDGSLAVRVKEGGALLKSGQYSQAITRDGTQAVLKAYGGTAIGKSSAVTASLPVADPVSAGTKVVMQAAAKAVSAASESIGLSQGRRL